MNYQTHLLIIHQQLPNLINFFSCTFSCSASSWDNFFILLFLSSLAFVNCSFVFTQASAVNFWRVSCSRDTSPDCDGSERYKFNNDNNIIINFILTNLFYIAKMGITLKNIKNRKENLLNPIGNTVIWVKLKRSAIYFTHNVAIKFLNSTY